MLSINLIIGEKMQIAIILLLLMNGLTEKYDFGTQKTNDWVKINDGVMGGLSQSNIEYTDNSVIFSGKVSLENNGGFVSFRANWGEYDLTKYSGIIIRYKSSGQTFGLMIENRRRFYYPYYIAEVEPSKDWKVLKILWSELTEYKIGKNTGKKVTDEFLKSAIRFGFINTSKYAGDFEFEIDYIEFI